MEIWVQLHGVPLYGANSETIRNLGLLIGSVTELDFPKNSAILCTNYPRVKLEISTSRPFIPGCSLPRKNMTPAQITFKYERLSNFCTLCGRLSHLKNFCPVPLAFCPSEGTFDADLRVETVGVRRFSRASMQRVESDRTSFKSGASSLGRPTLSFGDHSNLLRSWGYQLGVQATSEGSSYTSGRQESEPPNGAPPRSLCQPGISAPARPPNRTLQSVVSADLQCQNAKVGGDQATIGLVVQTVQRPSFALTMSACAPQQVCSADNLIAF